MKMFHFILVLGGYKEFDDDMAERIFDAGCDDGALTSANGVVYVEFDREDKSAVDAVCSAFKQLRKAGFDDIKMALDLATVPEIARRTGRSRQDVHQLIQRKSGFPAPIDPSEIPQAIGGNSPLWNWAEVEDFFIIHEGGELNYERGDIMGVFAALRFMKEVPGDLDRAETLRELAACT